MALTASDKHIIQEQIDAAKTQIANNNKAKSGKEQNRTHPKEWYDTDNIAQQKVIDDLTAKLSDAPAAA